jgi:hypothetical protein
MRKVLIISVLFACFFVSDRVSAQENSIMMTPQHAWNLLLQALHTGNSDNVKNACTEHGYRSLSSYVSPHNDEEPFASVFIFWGANWEKMKFSTELIWNGVATCIARCETATLYFHFLWTEYGWKLHEWLLNE